MREEARKFLLLISAWAQLGWYDIRSRYRRTFLGPLWIVLTTGMTVGCLGVVYGTLLGANWQSYLPYIAAGLIVWTLMSTLFIDGSLALITYKHVFHSFRLSPILPVTRVVVRSHIIFIHNLLIFVIVAFICKINFSIHQLLLLPAFILYLVNGLWVSLFLSLVCTRFRDIQPLVTAVVGILFLVTPIIWLPHMLGDRQFIAELNPFTHYIAIFREPMLGNFPELKSWLLVFMGTVVGIIFTAILYRRVRERVIFWL